jgi:hypothetical protein
MHGAEHFPYALYQYNDNQIHLNPLTWRACHYKISPHIYIGSTAINDNKVDKHGELYDQSFIHGWETTAKSGKVTTFL